MARVLVIGGGIGGLFAARLLARDQHEVTLAERAPRPVALGAGLVLPRTSIALLEREGVKARSVAQRLSALRIVGSDGRSRAEAANRFSLSRPELAAALIEGLDDLVDVRYGCDVQHITREGARVDVLVGNEADSFDFVVGADGIQSHTRPTHSSGRALRSSGQVCWRGIVKGARENTGTEMWDGFQRVGVVALSQQRSYVYIVRTGTQETVSAEQLCLIGPVGTSREADAIAAMQDLPPNEVLFHELWELRIPSWGSGRIALLGDAAHAITPNLGLGAALAIEDGVVLASALRHGLDHAARRYRARRAARVRAIQLASRAIGIAAHSDHRAARLIRRQFGLQRADASQAETFPSK